MSGTARQGSSAKKPNIVFILTDDLDLNSYLDPSRFPKVNSLLVDKGTTFSNYFVTDSLCCPSRSSTLRGQYVHEHGVFGNLPPSAGYRTGLLGKYLNGYPDTVDPAFVPPGWDEWDSPTSGGNPYSEYNYRLNENGKLVRYGSTPQDYLVDVLSRKPSEFIQQKND